VKSEIVKTLFKRAVDRTTIANRTRNELFSPVAVPACGVRWPYSSA